MRDEPSLTRGILHALPITLVLWVAIIFAAFSIFSARAHNAPSGAAYLPECCNQNDCADVPDRNVHEIGDGHVAMRIEPGAHPLWPKDKAAALYIEFGPQHRREPIDGAWHACFSPSMTPLCYHPPRRGL
jgi:hypothetical protein